MGFPEGRTRVAVWLLTSREHKWFSEELQGKATEAGRVLWKPSRVQGKKATRAALYSRGPYLTGLGQDRGGRKS